MLVVRNAQLAVFRLAAEESFAERARAMLERHWPHQCRSLGDVGVRASIGDGVRDARRFGIETERDVLRYLNARYALDGDPATVPELRAILERRTLSASVRMDRLSALVQHTLDEQSGRRR